MLLKKKESALLRFSSISIFQISAQNFYGYLAEQMAQKDKYLQLKILNKDYILYSRLTLQGKESSVTTNCSYVTILGTSLFQFNTLQKEIYLN